MREHYVIAFTRSTLYIVAILALPTKVVSIKCCVLQVVAINSSLPQPLYCAADFHSKESTPFSNISKS